MVATNTIARLAVLLACMLASAFAEKIEFSHSLNPKNTICFLEQIAEGNQGKCLECEVA